MEGGREKAGYYIMVKDGEITGGDGEPEEALALRAFHITARWAAICNQSGAFYGKEGGAKRRKVSRRCAKRSKNTSADRIPKERVPGRRSAGRIPSLAP